MGEDVVRHGSRTRRTGRGGRMSRWLLVAMALPTSLVGASVAGGAAPAPVAPPHIAAVIQAIEQSASQGGVNLEGKAWQLTQGNALSDAPSGNWLLQTPNCWGDPQCSPAQGQTHFLQALTQEISTAQTLVDITGLLPLPTRQGGAGHRPGHFASHAQHAAGSRHSGRNCHGSNRCPPHGQQQ